MNPVCYLDLDGVLVDFVKGALATHGRNIRPGCVQWNFAEQLGIPASDFWAPFGRDFWAGLDWTPEGREMLAGLEDLFGDRILLMTSPCATAGSVEGKLAWVDRELPRYRRQVFVGPAKHLAAGPGKFLVDDYDENVNKFLSEGGNALLVPRSWNTAADRSVAGSFDVADFLDRLIGMLS